MLAVVLALALQQDNPKAAYDFLRRHQNEDGSWGQAPKSCRCPVDLAEPRGLVVSAEVKERVQGLIEKLTGGDIEARTRAADQLGDVGDAAIAPLRALAQSRDTEHRGRADDVLRSIARRRQKPDLELTAFALIAFAEAGWGPCCTKEPEGATTRRGFDYVLTRQGSDGGFDGPLTRSLAGAWAVLRIYSQMGSNRFRDPARRAAEFALAQKPRSTEEILLHASCLIEAYVSALLPKPALDGAIAELGSRDGPMAHSGWALLEEVARQATRENARTFVAYDPAGWGPLTTRLVTRAVYDLDNVYWARRSVFTGGVTKDRTPNWTAWCAKLKKAVPVVMEPGCSHGAMGRGDVRDRLLWTAHLAWFYGHNNELR